MLLPTGKSRARILMVIGLLIGPTAVSAQPFSNPRSPGEFEEVQGVVISWFEEQYLALLALAEEYGQWTPPMVAQYNGLLETHLVIAQEALNEGIDVYVIDDTSQTMTWDKCFCDYHVGDTLTAYGVTSPNLHIVESNGPPPRAVWARDWGPFGVFRNEVDSLTIAGNPYDELIADHLGLPFVESQPIMDGGNFLTDGDGRLFCDNQQANIDESLFGLTDIDTVTDYKVHIDYYMKLLNEETILLNEVPHSNYHEFIDNYFGDSAVLDTIATFLAQQTSCYGRPYRIVRFPTAPTYDENNVTVLTSEATYANSLILNRTVLVPQYEYVPDQDSTALEMYRQWMPGYRVVGVPSLQYAGIGGTVHCITHQIASDEPIRIMHAWYQDTLPVQPGGYDVFATIQTRSGVAGASVYWSTNPQSGYQSVAMSNTGGDDFEATIPAQPGGVTVSYYIEATSNSVKCWQKPVVAPDGVYQFVVEGELTCDCPCHGDPVCDGVTDVFDVVAAVDVAFRGGTASRDPACPRDQIDVDCSGVIDVFDVVRYVEVAFRGGFIEEQFCDPCAE